MGASLAALALPLGDFLSPVTVSAATRSRTATGAGLEVRAVATAIRFSTDGLQRFEVDVPTEVHVNLNRDAILSLRWDARVMQVGASVYVVLRSGKIRSVPSEAAELGEAHFTIPADAVIVIPQARVQRGFPLDLVDAPSPSSVALGGRSTTLPVRVTAARAWGVELYAGWTVVRRQYVPTFVQLRSVGPHAAPSGLTVELDIEAGAMAELNRSTGRPLEVVRSAVSRRVVTLPVPYALSPGELWETVFPLGKLEGSVPILSSVPTASVLIPDSAGADARDTGRLTAAPVTSSGTPLSDSLAMGRGPGSRLHGLAHRLWIDASTPN